MQGNYRGAKIRNTSIIQPFKDSLKGEKCNLKTAIALMQSVIIKQDRGLLACHNDMTTYGLGCVVTAQCKEFLPKIPKAEFFYTSMS